MDDDQQPDGKTETKVNKVEKLTLFVTALGLLVSILGLFKVESQLEQANNHKKWDNYNAMNAAYHSLYNEVYDGDFSNLLTSYTHINQLSLKQLAWVRAYFDLYAEEFWLDQKNLIPPDMLNKQISGGVNLNLREHPIMIDGYHYWKKKGAFQHPEDFIPYVNQKIGCIQKNPKFVSPDPCQL